MERDKHIAEAAAGSAETRQYLTFLLADVTYALPVEAVKEIRAFTSVTPVPGAPAHVRGVMNLRGQVIPVMDLRARFGLPEREYDRFTVVILIHTGARVVGMVVDAVSDVIDIEPTSTADVPDLGDAVDKACLDGVLTIEDQVVLTLRIETIIDSAELGVAEPTPARGQDAA